MKMLEEELKKLKDIKSNKMMSDTENTPNSNTTQDILNTNIENEQSNPSIHSNQEKLEKNCSSEPLPKSINVKKKGRISFVECDVNDENNTEGKTSQKDCSMMQSNTHSYEDTEDDENIIKIKFSHSPHIPNIPETNNSEIQSPIDIYKIFFMPKSILKRSPNDMVPNQTAIPISDDSSTDDDTEDDKVKYSVYKSVSIN